MLLIIPMQPFFSFAMMLINCHFHYIVAYLTYQMYGGIQENAVLIQASPWSQTKNTATGCAEPLSSFPASLPVSLLPCLPPSLPPFSPAALLPYLPPSLPPSFPASLLPCLPPSLPNFFPAYLHHIDLLQKPISYPTF